MKIGKLLAAASVLLLVGAGCPSGQQPPAAGRSQVPPAELGGQAEPAQPAVPAQPATPPSATGTPAQPATPAEPAEPAAPPEVAGKNVTYNAQGQFEPNVLTVKAGTTVTWKNMSASPLWVASNPHPVHTDLAGFDAKTDIRTGETWSFTFTKPGNWGYHNHLQPFTTGTVIVQ